VEVHVDEFRKLAERSTHRHPERVCGRKLEKMPAVQEFEPGRPVGREPSRAGREIGGCERGRRAVDVREIGERSGDGLVDVPAAAAEEPRLETMPS
jgi:hypothetical protein